MSSRERRPKPSALAVGDPAEMLARLAGVDRLLVFPDARPENVRAFGLAAPADPKDLLRDASAAVDVVRCARLARSEMGDGALAALAAAANVSHLVIVRLAAKAGAPLAIAALDDHAEDAEVVLRISAAAVLIGAAIGSAGDTDTYLARQLQQVTAALDAEGTLRSANPALEQLAGLPLDELLGRNVVELFELRCRNRLKRSIDALRTKPGVSGVYCVSRADGASVPVLVRATSARVAREEASLWVIRALSPDEASREIVGRVATAIFPAAGTTIRADRLLSETADALDLRLVALATVGLGDRAPRIEMAAGPAVTRVDALSKLEAPTPWLEVFEKRAPLEIPDLSVVPAEASRVLHDLGFRAFLGLPIRAPDGSPLGVLLVLADTPRGFLPYEVAALRIVAEFLATDLDRRRAETALEQRATELAALLDATRDLASERDPSVLLGAVVQRSIDLVPAAQAGVLMLEDGGWLVPRSVRGVIAREPALRVRVPIARSAVGEAFSTRAGVLRTGPAAHKESVLGTLDAESAKAYREACEGLPPLKGLLAAPLVAGDRSVGVIALVDFGSELEFQPHDLQLLERFAGLAAAAIVQAQLFQAVRTRSALVEAVRDAVLSIDRAGTIRLANEGALALFGRESAAGAGGDIRALFESSEASTLTAAFDVVRERGHWFAFLRAVGPDGSAFDSAVSLSTAPEPESYVAIVSDVTERRRLEAQALQSQTLDSLGKLAAGIAHDFNNLLGGILGFASLLRAKVPSDSPLLDEIGGIERVADQAAQLASRLLALGRSAPATRRIVDLNAIVNDLATVLRHSLDRSIDLDVRLASRPCLIEGDATALSQGLLNLATNARDALPNGGRITITTEQLEPKDGEGPQVAVSVADDGTGMNPEVRAHLYEPFFTTKPPGKGTGLGCAIVFSIVRAHRGTIDCESAPNAGTRFRLSFPSAGTAQRVAPLPSTTETPRGTGTILLVEDEPVLRRVTADMIASLGYDCVPVPGGREAIEVVRARGSTIDAVILDLTMPGMSGTEVFSALRALDPSIRIVITTGYAAGDAAASLLERGAITLLPKPYRAVELARVIAQAKSVTRTIAAREIV